MWVCAKETLAQNYIWTTFAGNPAITNGNDGTNLTASFNQPTGVIADAAGNLYIADQVANTVRKITPAGVVTTLAGKAGTTGTNDGTGSAARFNHLSNLAQDSAGNIFVDDTLSHTIRKVTLGGVVTTFAGSPNNPGFQNGTGTGALFNQPNGLAFDSNNTMYVADGVNNAVRRVTTNGVVTTVSTAFNFPENVAVDSSGMVYVADAGNNTIDKMTPAGVVTVMAGQTGVIGSRDGTGSGALFSFPESLGVDNAGYVYVADYGNDTIRKITPGGVVTTIGGQVGIMNTNNGVGANALFNQQEGITADNFGNVYVADTQNNTIRIGYLGPPVIVVQPQSLGLDSGASATFSAVAKGVPPLTYQWLFNGATLTNNANVTGARSNVLSQSDVTGANIGTYVLVVSNAYGSVMTSNAILTVQTGALVQNGGFESGSFSGWTTNGDFDYCSIVSTNPYVHSGFYGAQLGPPGGFGFISQSLPTAAGQSYLISFWLNCDGLTPNEFTVSWNGSTLFDSQNIATAGWTNIQLAASATGTSSLLIFGFTDVPSYFGLDDIAVYTNVVTWNNPAAITYGTPLSGTQLNASASVPGSFTYNPPLGTVLSGGVNQLTVNFVPNDTAVYSNETVSVSLNVLPATLDVTANNGSRVYGSSNPAFTANYSGFVNGDSPTNNDVTGAPLLTTLAGTNSPVGAYVISNNLGSLASADYTFIFSNGALTVTPARLTVTANNTSRPYGSTNPVLMATYSGFVGGDSLTNSDVAGAPLLTTLAVTNSPPGAYVISNNLGSLNSTNYTLILSNGTLTVTPARLTIIANNASRTYGTTNTVLTATYNGFVNGQSLTNSDVAGLPLLTTPAGMNSPAGAYVISNNLGSLTSADYTFVLSNGTLTVTPARLTVTADNASRPYGSTNPVFTATYDGFVNGESLTNSDLAGAPLLTTLAGTNSPVGAYAISNSLGSLTSTNYTFTLSNGTLTVISANLIITANNASRPYGSTNPVFTAAVNGFVNGESLTSSDVAGAPLLTTVAVSNSPVGAYAISNNLGSLTSTNYMFAFSNGTLSVTAIGLTVTASNATKVFGQIKTFAGTEFSAIGLYGTDSVASVTLSSLGGPASAAVGQYPIVPSNAAGNGLGNYIVGYSNGVLTVTAPTPVTINAPLRLGNGAVELTFSGGDAGVSYRIQAASNVSSAAWIDLSTNLAGTEGLPGFIDLTSTNSGTRYYRTVTP